MIYRTKKKKLIKKELVCMVCGTVRVIPRSRSRDRKVGHNKPLFCAACKKPTLHYEL